jgi:hypothetical protein
MAFAKHNALSLFQRSGSRRPAADMLPGAKEQQLAGSFTPLLSKLKVRLAYLQRDRQQPVIVGIHELSIRDNNARSFGSPVEV